MTTAPPPGSRPARPALRSLWTLCAGLCAAWGLLAVAASQPWQAMVAVYLAAGLLATSFSLSAEAVTYDRIDLWRACRTGLVAGVVVLVFVGVVSTAGPVGAAVAFTVLLTTPGLWTRVRRLLRRGRDAAAGPLEDSDAWTGVAGAPDEWPALAPDPADPNEWALGHTTDAANRGTVGRGDDAPDDDWVEVPSDYTLTVPTHLSDHDLCLAWESSTRALRRCASVAARAEIVRVRQACLDELERRQPDAVRAWLLSGADPDVSPSRYLSR